jgi:hypothetical protein
MAEKDVRKLALITVELLQAQKLAVHQMQLGPDNPRGRLVLTLLCASLDHAEAAATLLSTQPFALGASAFALLRPQLETFCRALMFSSVTEVSDTEVRAFIEKDELPKRPGAKGKRVPIWLGAISTIALREVNSMADKLMGADSGNVFKRFVRFDKKDLDGLIHGGSVLLRMYQDGAHGIGFSPSHETTRTVLKNVGQLAQLAFTFAGVRIALPGSMINPQPMRKAWPPFCEHVAQLPIDPDTFKEVRT